jgi:RNA polymerase sigma-70 factor, ECF subfamily
LPTRARKTTFYVAFSLPRGSIGGMIHSTAAFMEHAALIPEPQLVASAARGDHGAFAELVRRYERAVRAICAASLRDEHLALDAAQDAFVAAYAQLKWLRNPSAFGPWLLTIARNKAMRLAKKHRATAPLPSELPARQHWPWQHEDLLNEVARLPAKARAVVTLRHFGGHSVNEIAAMLGRPVGTVTKQLSRSYERLAARLENLK